MKESHSGGVANTMRLGVKGLERNEVQNKAAIYAAFLWLLVSTGLSLRCLSSAHSHQSILEPFECWNGLSSP